MDFIKMVEDRAKKLGKTIVLPESEDIRTLEAAKMIVEKGIAKVILIGNEKNIKNLAGGIAKPGITIIDPAIYEGYERYAEELYEIRKIKGMTVEEARKTLLNPLYFGVMAVRMGEADGMVAGAVNSTSDTLRPALQILKTAPGTKIVSSFFVMAVPGCEYGENGVFIFSDCGLIEDPSAEELAEIALSAAGSFKQLMQREPVVGMLSYSTYGSAKSPLTEKVIEATRIAKEKAPSLQIDGELQGDAAIVPSIGRSKAKGSEVAGHCNTLIFPDLNSGNIAYKLVQRLAGAEAYGPITQGIARPVNDLSRGCTASDIVGVAAITAVQANKEKR